MYIYFLQKRVKLCYFLQLAVYQLWCLTAYRIFSQKKMLTLAFVLSATLHLHVYYFKTEMMSWSWSLQFESTLKNRDFNMKKRSRLDQNFWIIEFPSWFQIFKVVSIDYFTQDAKRSKKYVLIVHKANSKIASTADAEKPAVFEKKRLWQRWKLLQRVRFQNRVYKGEL